MGMRVLGDTQGGRDIGDECVCLHARGYEGGNVCQCQSVHAQVSLCVRGRAVAVTKCVPCLYGWQGGWEARVARGDTEVSHMSVALCQLHACAVSVQQPPRVCTWAWVCVHMWVLAP